MFIWPPGRKLKKKEKEEIQAVERECAEKADQLVCYHVKGFKKKTVKVDMTCTAFDPAIAIALGVE